jgi:arylsulfatase A-like enzyme
VGFATFGSALLIALYDLAVAAWHPNADAESVVDLLWFTPLLVIAIPAVAALIAVLVAWAESALSARVGHSPALRLGVDIVISAPLLALIPDLFSGPAIAASPWRWPLLLATILAALGAVHLLRRLTRALGERLCAPAGSRLKIAIPAAAAIALVIAAAHSATAWILPGHYESFHRALSLLAIGLGAAVIFALLTVTAVRLPGRRALILAVLAAALAWPLGSLATRGAPLGRQLLAEQAPFTGPFAGPLYSAARIFWLDSAGDETPGPGARRAGLADARFVGARQLPDVLVVTVDALRGDALDPASQLAKRTPRLQELARSSLRFSSAYSPSNYTPYSIPGLMLGFVPFGGDTPGAAATIADAFARGGYRTELYFTAHEYASLERTAVWPLASRGFHFERYHPQYDDAETVLGRAEQVLASSDEPVFVWVHLSDVHQPFLLRRRPDSKARAHAGTYAGQLEYLDNALGAWLERIAAADSSLIWALTSDHGESLGERGRHFHGSSLHDEQIRVPLLLGGPGVEPGRSSAPVSNTALPATLLALAGATLPDDAPTLPLTSDQGAARAPVLVVGRGDRCAIIDNDYKLIASPGDGVVALYQLSRDPSELRNLVGRQPARARRLIDALPALGCPFGLSRLRASLD